MEIRPVGSGALPSIKDIKQDRLERLKTGFQTIDLFTRPSFSNAIYEKNMGLINQRFQEATSNLNTYFDTAESSIKGSFAKGLESLNTNFQTAIQSVKDVAEPFRQSNLMAQQEYRNMLGLGDKSAEQIQSDLEKTPGYQFQYQQGQKALERAQAARGNLLSGRAVLEAQEFGQGMAQSAFQDRMSNLMGLMNATSPVLAQLTGQQAQLQAGLGQAQMGAQQAQAGMLSGLQAERGAQLAGLSQAQMGTELQQSAQKQAIDEQARLQKQQAQYGYLQSTDTAELQRGGQIAAAGLGAAAQGASAAVRAQSQEKQTGFLAGLSGR